MNYGIAITNVIFVLGIGVIAAYYYGEYRRVAMDLAECVFYDAKQPDKRAE